MSILTQEQQVTLSHLSTVEKAFLAAVYEVAMKLYGNATAPLFMEEMQEKHMSVNLHLLLKDIDRKVVVLSLLQHDLILPGGETGLEIIMLSDKGFQLMFNVLN